MKAQKFLKYFILLVVGANLLIVAMVLISGLSPKPAPMPNPNGYVDLVKAAQMVAETRQADNFQSLSKEDLATLVSTNEPALKLARAGLSHQCRIPEEYLDAHLVKHLNTISSFRTLVLVFCSEGRLAELEGRTNEAARAYLDGMRIGQESGRGGVILSRVVGIACETFALSHLEQLTNNLDGPESREISQTLQLLDAQEEPAQEILNREHAWVRKYADLRERIAVLWTRKSIQKQESDFIKKQQTNTLRRRRAMIAFAVHAYTLENGHPPQTLAELVPSYLKAIPQDPFTGTDIKSPPPQP